MASLAGLLCLSAIYLATRPLLLLLHTQWAVWPLLALFTLGPISVTFAVLYRSPWHQESPRVRRVISVILSSCVIFSVDLVAVGVLVLVGCLVIGLARSMGGN
jgi:hypothetical protein